MFTNDRADHRCIYMYIMYGMDGRPILSDWTTEVSLIANEK